MSIFPPDGWSENQGTWGPDMDVNTSTALAFMGANVIEYKNSGASQASLVSDYIPVQAGATYFLGAWIRATTTSATIQCAYIFYDNQFNFLSNGNAILGGPSIANRWEKHGIVATADFGTTAATQAAYVRLTIGRVTTGYTAYSAWVGIEEQAPRFSAYLNGSQSIGSGTPSKLVVYDATRYNYGGNPGTGLALFNTATGQFTAPYDSTWHFSAHGLLDNITSLNFLFISLFKNGAEVRRGTVNRYTHTGASTRYSTVNSGIECARGDIIDVRAQHNEGASRNLLGTSAAFNHFSGHEIR